jgi:hypothetical protein
VLIPLRLEQHLFGQMLLFLLLLLQEQRQELFTNTRNEWIIGPKTTIPTSNNSQISFKYAITDFISTTSADPTGIQGTDDKVGLYYTLDGCTFTLLTEINSSTAIPNPTNITFTTVTTPIPNSIQGQNVWFAFKATDGPVDDASDYDFHIDDVEIVEIIPPVITSLSTNSVCVNGTLTINGTGFGGTTSVTVGGTPATIGTITSTTLTVTVGNGTTGTVMVTTPFGSATSSNTVTVNPLPTVTASSDSPECSGGTVMLSAMSPTGVSYAWTGPLSFTSASQNPVISNITDLMGGTYNVVTTDANSCTGSALTQIVVIALPLIDATPPTASVSCNTITPVNVTLGSTVAEYTFAPSSGSFTPVTGGTSVSITGDDLHSAALPIGFNFVYGGVTYTDVYANSNGWISFNPSSGTATAAQWRTNVAATNVVMLPLLAPLWDDLDGTATGSASSYVVTGTAPNRVFTMEWLNWEWNWLSTSPVISFQIKLYEGTNNVEYVYREESGTPSTPSATIGMLSSTTNYLSLDGTGAAPLASSLVFTTNLSSKPATGQHYTFSPPSANYVWTGPAGTMYTDAAATVPYTGQNLSTIYTKQSSNGLFEYIVNATNPVTGCMKMDTVKITVTGCNAVVTTTQFFEGFMNGSTMRPVLLNSGISGATSMQCDTITVQLRNSTTPFAVAYETTIVMGTNGQAIATFPFAAVGGSYYIAVQHRNALETWSAAPVAIAAATSYNFTTAQSQAFGNNMVETAPGSGIWAFYTGDFDTPAGDGNVDLGDYPIWETDNNNFESGYRRADLNGDGAVDLIDYPIWETNANNFVSKSTP